jgi:hypothetical protein
MLQKQKEGGESMTEGAVLARRSSNKFVHRSLALVSPLLQGPDIRKLQEACNGLTDHYEFDWLHLKEDGDYGKRTARRAAFCMELIGIEQDLCDKARNTGHINEQVQMYLRNPEKRGEDERLREENRRPHFRELRRKHKENLATAVEFMIKHRGVNEEPGGSNHGPFPIDECQAWFGLSGVPWCGCAVGFAIESIAKFGKTGTWWPHAAFIRADAEGGRNGLEDINPNNAVLGNIATFFDGGDDHVAFVRGNAHDGVIPTVEGNTSSLRQDADGGIIETKERSISEVTCVARLTLH